MGSFARYAAANCGHGDATGEVVLDDVTLVRGTTTVFERLSLCLGQDRIGVIGNNGAGKSSLFRLLSGLEVPRAGRVLIHGKEAGAADGSVGLMFQNPDEQIIFPTVLEELALGLRAQGLTRREAMEEARALLAARGLAHWAERAVASLSQGQRQHVCWLALTATQPRLLLLDEPFASLDLPGQALLQREIEQAPQQVIVSTHALAQVRRFDRVIWLDRGTLRADGPGRDVCAAYEAEVATRMAARSLCIEEFQ